jgi:hypothetical protein
MDVTCFLVGTWKIASYSALSDEMRLKTAMSKDSVVK